MSVRSDWLIGTKSGLKPIELRLSNIFFSNSLVDRCLSVSSMRIKNNPPIFFAYT